MTHSITSDATLQTRVTRGDESTANYSSLGETCETIDSRRSDDKNQVLLPSKRHEFAGTQCRVKSSSGVSTEENTFSGHLIEHEIYAHLQHL